LGGSLLARQTRLKIERSGFIEMLTAILLTFFNPEKTKLVPDSSQPGKAVNCGSMTTLNISASSRRISRSELPLDQPAAIVTTNSKMGNNFLHTG
jgi:hypothetical protein